MWSGASVLARSQRGWSRRIRFSLLDAGQLLTPELAAQSRRGSQSCFTRETRAYDSRLGVVERSETVFRSRRCTRFILAARRLSSLVWTRRIVAGLLGDRVVFLGSKPEGLSGAESAATRGEKCGTGPWRVACRRDASFEQNVRSVTLTSVTGPCVSRESGDISDTLSAAGFSLSRRRRYTPVAAAAAATTTGDAVCFLVAPLDSAASVLQTRPPTFSWLYPTSFHRTRTHVPPNTAARRVPRVPRMCRRLRVF